MQKVKDFFRRRSSATPPCPPGSSSGGGAEGGAAAEGEEGGAGLEDAAVDALAAVQEAEGRASSLAAAIAARDAGWSPARARADSADSVADEAAPEGVRRATVADFTLLKVIGKGSFAKVVLVRKKDTGKLYAMKVLNKPAIIKRKQVEHTKTERNVLARVDHPYIVRCRSAFQTEDKLYFVLDYCSGGELFFHLSRLGKLTVEQARVYAAELALALEHLHGLGVAYRDIKPENMLLDAEGHLKLADFGLAKDGVTRAEAGANSLCGTPEYLAPEVLERKGHGTAVDWWGLGMVLYEMLTGLPPWYTRDKQKLFRRLRSAPLKFPRGIDPDAASLISALLDRDPTQRLGANSADEVKAHPFFAPLNWGALMRREVPAPLNPSDAGLETGEAPNVEENVQRIAVESSMADPAAAEAAQAELAAAPEGGHFRNFTFDGGDEDSVLTAGLSLEELRLAHPPVAS